MIGYRYFGSRVLAWLTLTEITVWLAVTILGLLAQMMHFVSPVADWLTLPSDMTLFRERPWTLLTYMAVHFDFFHVLFNVLWLYWFGKMLLITLSDRHLLLAFAGGGIAGGLLFLIAAALGYGGGWLCGCSAAVIAVMCLAAIRIPDYPVHLFLIGEVKLKWVAVACCVLTFLGGGGNQAAHVGGLIWGVCLGLMLKKGVDPVSRFDTSFRSKDKDSRRSGVRMAKVLHDRQADIRRLDQLLDKIKLSGYESLSRRERLELQDLSSRLKKTDSPER